MKDKFKVIFDEKTVKTVMVSLITVIAVLLVSFAILWHNRGEIFKYMASGYAESLSANDIKKDGDKNGEVKDKDSSIPAMFSDETLVENSVESANPAVVAITISKEVTKYKTSYQQYDPFQGFGNLFGDNSPFQGLQVPVQTPDGTEKQQVGAGSGFIVTSDGLIVTNKHVVSDKTAEYEVNLSNGKKYPATVLARDSVLDIAVIKISASGLPYLGLGDSSKLKLGQSVIAIGNALGQFQNTVSVGVVSGLSRSITAGGGGMQESLSHVIQTDAAINPGNSGGPLLDLSGKVIGVNVAIVQGSQNIGFALPINSIKSVIDSVKTTGKIVRPYIGIRYQTVTSEMQKANNLTVDYGVIVKAGSDKNSLAVIPGSPADKAGILENDIILELDGQKLDSEHDLSQMIRTKNVGDTITFKILSKGVQKQVSVKLESAPEDN